MGHHWNFGVITGTLGHFSTIGVLSVLFVSLLVTLVIIGTGTLAHFSTVGVLSVLFESLLVTFGSLLVLLGHY